jgi:hypothetical protein
MHRVARALVVVTTTLVFQSCGGKTSEKSSVEVRSGLPPASPLESLDAASANRLCEAELRAARESITSYQICTFLAVLDGLDYDASGEYSVDREYCEFERRRCLDSGEAAIESLYCHEARSAELIGGCSASVEQYEHCSTATLRSIEQALAGLSCNAPPSEQALGLIDEDPTTRLPECAELQELCPWVSPGNLPTDGWDDDDWGGSYDGPEGPGCTNTCVDAYDGFCDDGGPGSQFDICPFGTDCGDCGPR